MLRSAAVMVSTGFDEKLSRESGLHSEGMYFAARSGESRQFSYTAASGNFAIVLLR